MLPCQMTYSSGRQQDLIHINLLMFISIDQVQKLNLYLSIYLYIFGSMLKIFIMPSNREQSINDKIRKIFSTMTKKFMVSLVCLCVFDGNEDENRKHLFIEVFGCCGPQKLSVQYGPHKRILCRGSSEFIIRIVLAP